MRFILAAGLLTLTASAAFAQTSTASPSTAPTDAPVQPPAAEAPAPAAPAAPAVAVKTPDEIKAEVEKRFGVQVLRVDPVTRDDGGAAYAVTVLTPGGDRNGALAVDRLEVDAASGALVPQFRQTASGYTLSASPNLEPNRGTRNAAIARGHTWR